MSDAKRPWLKGEPPPKQIQYTTGSWSVVLKAAEHVPRLYQLPLEIFDTIVCFLDDPNDILSLQEALKYNKKSTAAQNLSARARTWFERKILAPGDGGVAAFIMAAWRYQPRLIDVLLKDYHVAVDSTLGQNPLLRAQVPHLEDCTALHIISDVDEIGRAADKSTETIIACAKLLLNGHADIDRGCHVFYGDETDSTQWLVSPLSCAVRSSCMPIAYIKLLLEEASVEGLEDTDGMTDGVTPLHFAAIRPDPGTVAEIIRLLVEHGADVYACDACLRTPLWLALAYGVREAAKALIKHGAKMWHMLKWNDMWNTDFYDEEIKAMITMGYEIEEEVRRECSN